jgi:hypothetical protein
VLEVLLLSILGSPKQVMMHCNDGWNTR